MLTYKAWDGNTISLTGLLTSFNAREIKLSSDNTKAFVARSRVPFDDDSIPSGLVILDLSTPNRDKEVRPARLSERRSGGMPDDKYVYLAEGELGSMADVSDPDNPTLISISIRWLSATSSLQPMEANYFSDSEGTPCQAESGLRIIDGTIRSAVY